MTTNKVRQRIRTKRRNFKGPQTKARISDVFKKTSTTAPNWFIASKNPRIRERFLISLLLSCCACISMIACCTSFNEQILKSSSSALESRDLKLETTVWKVGTIDDGVAMVGEGYSATLPSLPPCNDMLETRSRNPMCFEEWCWKARRTILQQSGMGRRGAVVAFLGRGLLRFHNSTRWRRLSSLVTKAAIPAFMSPQKISCLGPSFRQEIRQTWVPSNDFACDHASAEKRFRGYKLHWRER